jgi:hypothetical protein
MSRADEVDLDLLADFAAGALDPSESAEVAHLVATDVRWSAALYAVRAADDLVRSELSDLALSSWEPMPADVALRLDDAFRTASPSNVVPLAAAKPRSRKARYFTGFAAAAATLVLVLFGVTVSRGLIATPGTSSAQHAPAADRDANGSEGGGAPPPVIVPTPSAPSPGSLSSGEQPVLVVATNVNYTLDALRELNLRPTAPDATKEGALSDTLPVPTAVRQAAPTPLARLTDPAALRACLVAVRAAHPGVPVLVDYANFEGQPALIVSLRGKVQTTVAVGPDCGLGGATAELASA